MLHTVYRPFFRKKVVLLYKGQLIIDQPRVLKWSCSDMRTADSLEYVLLVFNGSLEFNITYV
jgi:hypothetical protein